MTTGYDLPSGSFVVKHEVMGFFSSRRPEELEEKLKGDASVVQVIRSRFVRSSSISGRPFRVISSCASHCSTANTRVKVVKLYQTLKYFPFALPPLPLQIFLETIFQLMTLAVCAKANAGHLLHLRLPAHDLQTSLSLRILTARRLMLSRETSKCPFLSISLTLFS